LIAAISGLCVWLIAGLIPGESLVELVVLGVAGLTIYAAGYIVIRRRDARAALAWLRAAQVEELPTGERG
jgi:hypothetical protein